MSYTLMIGLLPLLVSKSAMFLGQLIGLLILAIAFKQLHYFFYFLPPMSQHFSNMGPL